MLATREPNPRIVFAMNPFQQVLVDAMNAQGIEWGKRGWQAELSRRSGVSEQILSNIFNREAYLPEPRHREGLARALGIPKSRLDAAGAEIKGLRAHGSVLRTVDQLNAELVLAADDLTPEEIDEAHRQLQALVRQLAKRRGQGKK